MAVCGGSDVFSVAEVAFFSQITATTLPEVPQTATECHRTANPFVAAAAAAQTFFCAQQQQLREA
ncbi:MAG TPA: hypothetical protein VK003_08825 [Oceanobacillus sp.]|nr:hypothetical protein [Oceanobacillus sp.]